MEETYLTILIVCAEWLIWQVTHIIVQPYSFDH